MTADGRKFKVRRLSLAALARGELRLDWVCPECGGAFKAKFSGETWAVRGLTCPHCRHSALFSVSSLKNTFERQMRRLLARLEGRAQGLEAAGRVIANAVTLLKPALTIVILGQYAEFIGHQVNFPSVFLARARSAGFSAWDSGEAIRPVPERPFSATPHCGGAWPHLGRERPQEGGSAEAARPLSIFSFVSDPGKVANLYLMELWNRRFIVTQAAKVAYDLLRDRPGQAGDNSLFNFHTTGWGFGWRHKGQLVTKQSAIGPEIPVCELDYSIVRLSQTFGPKRMGNLIDLRDSYWSGDFEGLLAGTEAPFVFSEEEHQRAAAWRESLGLENKRPYVCFLGWDNLYYQAQRAELDYSYFNFRAMDINSFLPAMRRLLQRGAAVFRMGSAARVKLAEEGAGLIDYAFLPRSELSEFLDIYLAAHCLFYVSSDSGPNWIPVVMGRPLLILNGPNLSSGLMHNSPNVFYAFRRMRHDSAEGELLSFDEILSKRLDLIARTQQLKQDGVVLEPLSGEEMALYVEEMYARVTGQWQESQDEARLQNAFRGLIDKHYPGFDLKSKVLYTFLDRNRELL